MGDAHESVTIDIKDNVAQVTLVGPGKGSAMGRGQTAARAEKIGLVNDVYDDVDAWLAVALETAAEFHRGIGVQPSSAFALALDSGSHVVPNAVAG